MVICMNIMEQETRAPKKKTPQQVEFPLDRAFTFVESGPVLLISTRHNGKSNLMTVSWHAAMGFEPTLGIFLGLWNTAIQPYRKAVNVLSPFRQ